MGCFSPPKWVLTGTNAIGDVIKIGSIIVIDIAALQDVRSCEHLM